MRLAGVLTGLFLAATTAYAVATPILEGWKSALTLNYENGDSLAIHCTDGEKVCALHITVNSQSFQFGPGDLDNLRILPDSADLYAAQGGDRSTHFAFRVSVACPEETATDVPAYECFADVAVIDGKTDVRLERSQRTTSTEPAPNNSFKGMPLRGTP